MKKNHTKSKAEADKAVAANKAGRDAASSSLQSGGSNDPGTGKVADEEDDKSDKKEEKPVGKSVEHKKTGGEKDGSDKKATFDKDNMESDAKDTEHTDKKDHEKKTEKTEEKEEKEEKHEEQTQKKPDAVDDKAH